MIAIVAIILGVILCIGLFTIGFQEKDWVEFSIFSASLSFVAFVISLVFAIASSAITSCQYKAGEKKHYYDIVSLRNDSAISGSFFLGCGNIRGSEYYYCFKKKDDGSFRRVNISTSDSSIFENDKVSPRVEWTEYTYKKKWWYRSGLNYFDRCATTNSEYTIIVPRGTVIQKFEAR